LPPLPKSHQQGGQVMQTKVSLRPYQLEALAYIEQSLSQGITRQAISAPTGAGKTILFAELIRRRQHLGRALVLAHRDELVQQAIDKIKFVIPNAGVGKVKAESNELNAPIIVGSVQTLSRDGRLNQLKADFKTVIVDEAHHATATSYRKILDHIGCFEPIGEQEREILLLGVSATLERTDKAALGDIFQEIVYQIDLLQLIKEQYLVDLKAQQIEISEIDLDSIKTAQGDFSEVDLSLAMERANAPWQVAESLNRYASERKAIVFTPSVKLAYQTMEALQNVGFSAETVDANTGSKQRRSILERLRSGKTQVVVNCGVLTEGFDETSIDCVVLARPTKSKSLYIQMVGRGTRPHPGKENCLVLDCVGATKKHDLVSIASLLGLGEENGISKTVDSVAKVLEDRQNQGYQFIDGKLVAYTVDLFAFRKQKQHINWLTLNPHCHAINLGNNSLLVIVANKSNSWDIFLFGNKQSILLHSNLELDLAMGVVENIARNEARFLVDTQAAWRNHPVSEKQISALRMCRLKVKKGMTKGEAADLLTLFFAQQQLRELQKTA